MPGESLDNTDHNNAREGHDHAGQEPLEMSKDNVLEKKPKNSPRTPEQRFLDRVIAEQTKVNEKVAAARRKVAASDRKTTFAVTWQVIHSGVLAADQTSRDNFLTACNTLLAGKRRPDLVEYRKAVAAEIEALAFIAEAAAKAGGGKKGISQA